MLIWIAAYPGSLDYVFLQALHQHFGVHWYEADILDQSALPPEKIATHQGQKSTRGSWRAFYERALESDKLVLARTRILPSDSQPFIYISRDGSEAIREFLAVGDHDPTRVSAASLILGHHLYADWTSHYNGWKNREVQDNGMFLRIEDFIENPAAFEDQLASKLAKSPTSTAFEPGALGALQQSRDSLTPWSPGESALYAMVHGQSAKERGYKVPDSEAPIDAVPFPIVDQFLAEHRKSIEFIGQMHEMRGYIESLKSQLAEETERLRDYIEVLKNENSRRENGG